MNNKGQMKVLATLTLCLMASAHASQDLYFSEYVEGSSNRGGVGLCGDAATLISAIQGSGSATPMAGQQVEIEGVVVGDFQGSDSLRGFFVQEEDTDSDADSSTSEGIFVFESSGVDVNPGDRVRVAGSVSEYYDMTQIGNVTSVVVCANNQWVTPAAISMPFADSTSLEAVEGMAIVFNQTLTVTENYDLGRYGELTLSANGRLFIPTNVVAPGAAANDLQAQNDLNRIQLDDGRTAQNPDPVIFPAPGLSAYNTVRSGDTVTGLQGVVNYAFGKFRVQPTTSVAFTATNPRPLEPALEKSDKHLRVASFNVLNYFNGDGLGGGYPTARGANNLSEFERQRSKIISAILSMDADVIGLMEIENDGYKAQSAIADLVAGVNALSVAEDTYDFVNPGTSQLGTDAITVGMIYRPAKVTPVGSSVTLSTGAFADKNRQPLVQTFLDVASEKELTLVVNHFKSKGSCPTDGSANEDQNDGQGCWNAIRTEAANQLADWLATNPTGSDTDNVLIMGDLNAYLKEDPISALKAKGYENLIETKSTEANPYSYIFYGQAGNLDHAMASASLSKKVKSIVDYHINTDEPKVLDYNEEFKSANQITTLYNADAYRASDHDPVVIDLKMGGSIGYTFIALASLLLVRRKRQQ